MNSRYPIVKLGEIIYQDRERIGTLNGNGLPVLGVTNIDGITITGKPKSQDLAKYIYLRPHRFVYNPYRINVGSIGFSSHNQEGIVSPAYIVFGTKESVNPLYLYWFLKSREGHTQINFYGNRGTVRSALRFADLCRIEIPLPSFDEQTRIVTHINTFLSQLEKAQELRHQTVEEVERLFAITCGTIFNELDEEYSSYKLKELVRVVGGGTPSKHNPLFWSGSIPWVSPKDMKVFNITETEDHITEEAIKSSSTTLIPINSLLIVVRSGILRRILPVAINRIPVTINQDMKALIPQKDNILCEYLAWWFKSKQSVILENVKGGTTVQSLVWDKVKEIDVCVPPLYKQYNIVEYIDNMQEKLDRLRRLQKETQTAMETLFFAILCKAFAGEL